MQRYQGSFGFSKSPPSYSEASTYSQRSTNAQPPYNSQFDGYEGIVDCAPPAYSPPSDNVQSSLYPEIYVPQEETAKPYHPQVYSQQHSMQPLAVQSMQPLAVQSIQPVAVQHVYPPRAYSQQPPPPIVVNVASSSATQMNQNRRYVIQEKILSLGGDYTIKDEYDKPCFNVRGKLFSIGDDIVVEDRMKNSIIKIKEEVLHFMPHFNIVAGSNKNKLAVVKLKFALFTKNKKFKVKSVYGDYVILGVDIANHAFTMHKDGQHVATVGKNRHSKTDRYGVEVIPTEDQTFILALVIVIDRVLFNR